jgi:signal transduction histidine kinase/DNA-binding response OmpR family regulator/ligand-binding sensor domain-containing protein
MLVCSKAYSSPLHKVEEISLKEGLLLNAVYQVVEDHFGIIWISGEGGLIKYDGLTFKKVEIVTNDPTVHSSITVRCLLVDSSNNLWVGTERGLLLFERATEKFISIDFGLKGEQKFRSTKIRTIYEDANSNIWVGSYAGLSRIDNTTRSVVTYPSNTVRSIISLDDDYLLVGTLGYGLYKFDITKEAFKAIVASTPSPKEKRADLSRVSIIDLTKRSPNTFLIGTWGHGVYQFESDKSRLVKLPLDLPSAYVSVIEKDSHNNFWIGTQLGNLVVDPLMNTVRNLSIGELNKYSRTPLVIRDIAHFSMDKVWFATNNGGIYVIDSKESQFESYTQSISPKYGLKNRDITMLVELPNKKIAIGYEGGGLSLFDATTKKFEHFNFEKNGKPYPFIANAIFELPHGDYLISSRGGKETIRFNPRLPTMEITQYNQFEFLKRYALRNTFSGHVANEIEKMPMIAIDKTDNKLVFLEIDKDNKIFVKRKTNIVSTHQELKILTKSATSFILSEITGKVRHIYLDSQGEYVDRVIWNNKTGLYQTVTSDRKGHIYIVSYDSGVYRSTTTNLSALNFEKILDYPGLYELIFEAHGDIGWLSSNNGLIRLELLTGRIEKFHKSDGLQENEFNNESFIAKDGTIYFGGVNGFSRFKPENISKNRDRLAVVITDFSLSNRKTSPDSTRNTGLLTSIESTSTLKLSRQQNNFGFNFSTIVLPDHQRRLEYAYQLEGYDKTWNHVDYTQRYANYTNIPAGDYTFRVKVKNQNGLWSEKDRTIDITVLPPWWKTIWAYVIYILLFALSMYLVIYFRTRSLERNSLILANQVKQRTFEVEQLLENKNKEFANVSHEFRTPLTLILGPVTQLLKSLRTKVSKKEIEQLEITQRNGYRLLRMVDQLLNAESFQVKSIVQKQPTAFADTLSMIAQAFDEIAKQRNIHFELLEVADVCFEFTPDAFDKILLNLLSNAFKYSPNGASVYISSEVTSYNELKVAVRDTGIGIPLDEQSTIFERFNRSTNVNIENAPGAGIGLSLVKSLVELHKGRIELNSEPGVGTLFEVYLPIINPVDREDVKRQADEELIAIELMSIASSTSYKQQLISSELTQNDNVDKVLIIEDNDDMRQFIADSLASSYQILTAVDGEDGLEKAKEEIPDLIICDIMMPKLDGYQVTNQLRQMEATNHIPIVLLTAKNDRVSRMKGWHEKADEYLTKPFDINELNVRVKNLLDVRDILKKRYGQTIFNPEELSLNSHSIKSHEPQGRTDFVHTLERTVAQCYDEHELTIPVIASKMAMSDRQFYRKLKATIDMTPTEYLKKYRLEQAKTLLLSGANANIAADKVGFSSASYFASCFKAYVGCKPSEYIEQI